MKGISAKLDHYHRQSRSMYKWKCCVMVANGWWNGTGLNFRCMRDRFDLPAEFDCLGDGDKSAKPFSLNL